MDTDDTSSATIVELHACQGLNACKGHGANGSGTQAGDGSCATANIHDCGTHNDCRGQGGCGYPEGAEHWLPNENACKGLGGCGSPIPPAQVFSGGPDKGGNVWDRARSLFEARMKVNKKPFAAASSTPSAARKSLKPTSS